MIPAACAPAAFPVFRYDGQMDTVLVVEDEMAVCELAAEALSDEGYRVLTAADANEAEAILEGERVDLLFTDIDLARNTNGIALAHSARRRRPDLPVVYTSGGCGSLLPNQAVTQSVFVPKPYRPSDIVALTNGILGRSERRPA